MKQLKLVFVAVTFFVGTIQVNAQDYLDNSGTLIKPRVYAVAGGYFPELTTSLRVDSKRGIGTDVSLEDLFKLDNQLAVFRTAGIVRLGKRHHIQASFTNIKRTNTLSLERDINFGDTTFYAGAEATLKFDVTYLAATYRYSIFEQPNWNAGFSAGLRYVRFNTRLNASFNGKSFGEQAVVGAPALLLGLHGSAYLTPRLLGRYSLEFFYLSVADVNIRVLENNFSLQYFLTKNIGLGAGYAGSNYQVRQIPLSDDFKGKVIFAFEGFTLFASIRI